MQSILQCIYRTGCDVVSKCTPDRRDFNSVAQLFDVRDRVVSQCGSASDVSKCNSLVTDWIYLVGTVDRLDADLYLHGVLPQNNVCDDENVEQ